MSRADSFTYTLFTTTRSIFVRSRRSGKKPRSQLSKSFPKSLTGLFRVAYRRVSVNDVMIPVLLVPQFLQPVRIGIVSANLVQDRRNNSTNPIKESTTP